MDRREIAEQSYRQKFDELGLDFTFLRREWSGKRDRRFWVKCNRCGAESLRYNDVLRGRQQKLICKVCGNGREYSTALVDEMVKYYSEGHTQTEVAEHFGLKKTQISVLLKRRQATNGRTFEQGGRECNKQRAEDACFSGLPRHKVSHYARAKMRGLPAEVGITLDKLISRDGGICAICGLICFCEGDKYSDLYPSIDHIIPISKGGGHVWSNVQLAHRGCNIRKSNLMGEEWNNGTTKAS